MSAPSSTPDRTRAVSADGIPGLRRYLYALLVSLVVCAALLAGCVGKTDYEVVQANVLVVSAAADLTPAFQELGKEFERQEGTSVIFNFGSTGQLAQQIEQGAPVDLFAAANVSFIEGLEQKNLIIPDTKALYAQGRITLWTRDDSPLKLERVEDLARPEFKKVAIANPEHAPYGMAAREALQTAGVWETVSPKLVYGENVSQTLQYAESGNVDAAVVALSLSTQSKGRWVLIPAEMHKPLNQALGVVKGSKHEKAARRFAAFVNSTQGRNVMRKYGFILPGEEPVQ
ncbi:MAG: molybdate transport system substrate-binding protein [Acidobacteriota bacterium]|jgi:molybdate transport system substrate-binding protein|nr:molybdate transport system substrate-binding protein [Acidobacteriota bacterium]